MAKNIFHDFNKKSISQANIEAIKISRKNNPCIFLSHQKGDRETVKKIANYLIERGVSVYFDEYDEDAKLASQSQNPKAVTAAILKGIQLSSHMVCIVSQNTIKSTWVPFELGFGYDKLKIGILMLKGINFDDLPEYVQSVEIYIRDIYDLNELIQKVLPDLPYYKASNNYNDLNHPLLGSMERFIQ